MSVIGRPRTQLRTSKYGAEPRQDLFAVVPEVHRPGARLPAAPVALEHLRGHGFKTHGRNWHRPPAVAAPQRRQRGNGTYPRLGRGDGGGVAAVAPHALARVLALQEEALAPGRVDAHAETADGGVTHDIGLAARAEAVDPGLVEMDVGHWFFPWNRLHRGKFGRVPSAPTVAIARKNL